MHDDARKRVRSGNAAADPGGLMRARGCEGVGFDADTASAIGSPGYGSARRHADIALHGCKPGARSAIYGSAVVPCQLDRTIGDSVTAAPTAPNKHRREQGCLRLQR